MSRRVYRNLSNDMVRRMRNWARWASDGGAAPILSCAMWGSAPSGRRGDIVINTMAGEAMDTDTAINAIPVRYGQAIRLFWQYERAAMAYLAKRCGIGCDYRTFEQRVIDGHEMLSGEVSRRSDALFKQREAFEKTCRAA